jgi:hypothetical protein
MLIRRIGISVCMPPAQFGQVASFTNQVGFIGRFPRSESTDDE